MTARSRCEGRSAASGRGARPAAPPSGSPGVKALHDGLKVRILDTERRNDADLRGAVLQALALDYLVPSTVDAEARDRVVTLTGWAPYSLQRDKAELVAGNVRGVAELHEEIEVRIGPAT